MRTLTNPADRLLVVEVLESLRSGWVAQPQQRLGLDLPDPFAGHPELLPNLFEREPLGPVNAESVLDDFAFSFAQSVEDVKDLILERLSADLVSRR